MTEKRFIDTPNSRVYEGQRALLKDGSVTGPLRYSDTNCTFKWLSEDGRWTVTGKAWTDRSSDGDIIGPAPGETPPKSRGPIERAKAYLDTLESADRIEITTTQIVVFEEPSQ